MANRVRQCRNSLGLSQRKLAEMVGTSQQQIQRIETGLVAARVELAAKICAALGKPLNVVFPGAAKAFKDADKEMKETKSLPDDAWAAMRDIGLEGDPRIWTLRVLLNGHSEYMLFRIAAQEQTRLYSVLQDEDCGSGLMKFVVFATEDRKYALNLSEVSLYQFLFDVGGTPVVGEHEGNAIEDANNGECDLHIFFCGQQSPVSLEVGCDETDDDEDSLGQCGLMLSMLETFAQESDRYRIIDIDGEHAFIRAGNIALLSVPLSIVEPSPVDDEEE